MLPGQHWFQHKPKVYKWTAALLPPLYCQGHIKYKIASSSCSCIILSDAWQPVSRTQIFALCFLAHSQLATNWNPPGISHIRSNNCAQEPIFCRLHTSLLLTEAATDWTDIMCVSQPPTKHLVLVRSDAYPVRRALHNIALTRVCAVTTPLFPHGHHHDT